jgi:hypothetical protein
VGVVGAGVVDRHDGVVELILLHGNSGTLNEFGNCIPLVIAWEDDVDHKR